MTKETNPIVESYFDRFPLNKDSHTLAASGEIHKGMAYAVVETMDNPGYGI